MAYVREHREKDIDPRLAPDHLPPVPSLAWPFRLRELDFSQGDAELIHRWLNLDHLAKAWECAWSFEKTERYLKNKLEGHYSLPLIVEFDYSYLESDVDRSQRVAPENPTYVPTGYIELYYAIRDEIADHYDASKYDIGIHIAIADTDTIGKGVWSVFYRALVLAIRESSPKSEHIMSDPDVRNTAAIRLDRKHNWISLGEIQIRKDRRIELFKDR